MKDPKVAVIILTYNRYKEFSFALKSALSQKGLRFHIFVFDNGSKKPIADLIPQNSLVTHIRHRKNIGFAANFKYATQFVKKRGLKYTFLLGDDDYIIYPHALRDLYMLIEKNPAVHVVRGGYVEFVNWPPQFTRILTFTKHDFKKFAKMSTLDGAIAMHITSYSGVLFRNDFFNPYFSPYDDLITPFIAPLFNILMRKKFVFLSNKITVCVRTDHAQLATDVYNENVSNQDALEKAFNLLGQKYQRYVSLYELINYKIYSHSRKTINEYYRECLKMNAGLRTIPYRVSYHVPSAMLKMIKKIYKEIIRFYVTKELKKNHKYLDTFIY